MTRFIRFLDGNVMEFSAWRAMLAKKAHDVGEHGVFMYRLGRMISGWKAFSAINLAIISMPLYAQGRPFLSGFCEGGAMICLGFSLWMRQEAIVKRHDCLLMRQAILDDIRATERVFEALEKAENE